LEQEIRVGNASSLSNETALMLIKKIEGGDRSALATLYDKTGRLLFGLVLAILGSKALAEETLLGIYTQIWKQSVLYDPRLLPLEWLLKVARAQAIAILHERKHVRRKRELAVGHRDSKPTVAPNQQKLARSAIEALVPAQREALDWAYYSGLSCNEIAAQIGKPTGAVRTYARFGMSRLSESLRPIFEGKLESKSATEEIH
jgi:RNA polymerase sigma-70 factor (ECF subfamily)